METISQSAIAMLAVINPFVCGAILLQTESTGTTKSKVFDAVKVMSTVLVILLMAGVFGHYILKIFGISMDAIQNRGRSHHFVLWVSNVERAQTQRSWE